MLADGNYTRVARMKLAALILQEDFQAIEIIDSELCRIEISFTGGKRCTVDSFGKVLWQTPQDDQLANSVKEIFNGQ